MSTLPLGALLTVFGAAAAVVWVAGARLSSATDVLSTRLGLGEALGGLILLAIATNLPEIAIVASASFGGDLGVAVGNILGGIAIQTVVLVVLDAVGVGGDRPLSYRAASLVLVLEASLVIAVLVVVVMGSQLPAGLEIIRVGPASVVIAVLWAMGLWLVGRARNGLPWHEQGQAPQNQGHPAGHSRRLTERKARENGVSTFRAGAVFGLASLATLAAGVVLERSGEGVADHIGMSGVLFGSTVLAAATALPEISTGLASVRLADYQLAMSDIFGGNAFLPVLFLLASLLSGQAVLPQAQRTDLYLTGLGVLLTVVYIVGLVFRPTVRVARMGIDSLAVLIIYLVGLVGLVAVAMS